MGRLTVIYLQAHEDRTSLLLRLRSDHQKLTDAGWSYRANDRGWVVYRDPQTGLWHPRLEAIGIIEPFEPAKGVPGVSESLGT